jgi:hypothetical protein
MLERARSGTVVIAGRTGVPDRKRRHITKVTVLGPYFYR